jgi:hypothetical protein
MKIGIIAVLAIAVTVANVGAALVNLSSFARAEVAGMSSADLRRDRDFRRAVQSIVEGCSISGSSISC